MVDERMHHSLPMTEAAVLVDAAVDRTKLPATSLPITTVENVMRGLESLGGRSLEEVSRLSTPSTPQDAASQLSFVIANVVRPYLNRVFSETTTSSLADRLVLAPSIIPLSARSGPPHSADGVLKDSYLLCVKAVVPSSVSIPGRPLNWLPFQLYRAQSECVAQVPISSSTSMRPGTGVSTASNSSPFDGKSYGSSSAGHDRGDDDLPFPLSTASPFSSTAFPPPGSVKPFPSSQSARFRTTPPGTARSGSSFPRSALERDFAIDEDSPSVPSSSRSAAPSVPAYSVDWAVDLVKATVAGQEQGWRAWDVPSRHPPRVRTASNPARDR